jgi:exopolyphosphatase/guanosine-5'-triphosphate,3'-diphosphate pyrophosphatase
MSVGALSAIIDIGSNSVRFVVYDGPKRAPAVLFNEKVMAGLGAALAETGVLSEQGMARALTALRRYHTLAQQMGVLDVHVVATAAVREAANAASFIAKISEIGFAVEILSGDQEARAAGYGVISAIPEADGIVGDLGGGSLELVRVREGEVHQRVSLPLGVLRSRALIAKGEAAVSEYISSMLAESGWTMDAKGLPFYLVGGSWRSLARFHMRLSEYPLRVLHQYEMQVAACRDMIWDLERIGPQQAKAMAVLPSSRLTTLGDAALVLAIIAEKLKSSYLIISAHGLREGLLFQQLNRAEQQLSPLIEAARAEGARQGRFAEHGDLLNAWITPLFCDDEPNMQLLRHTACLLSDVGWSANPDFRAERGVDIALHGNWVGIDARGRAIVAQTLFTGFGGGQSTPDVLSSLAEPDALAKAIHWGLAMRLGQRLSGGLAGPLVNTSLKRKQDALVLSIAHSEISLLGDVVERRFKNLANALGLPASFAAI